MHIENPEMTIESDDLAALRETTSKALLPSMPASATDCAWALETPSVSARLAPRAKARAVASVVDKGSVPEVVETQRKVADVDAWRAVEVGGKSPHSEDQNQNEDQASHCRCSRMMRASLS